MAETKHTEGLNMEAFGRNAASQFTQLQSRIDRLEAEKAELVDVLKELTDLMQDTIDGTYNPDSLTLQPARTVLAKTDPK